MRYFCCIRTDVWSCRGLSAELVQDIFGIGHELRIRGMFHHILKISFGQTGFICMKIADSSVVEGKIRKAVSLDCGSEIRNSRFIVFPVHADGTKVEIAFSQVSTLFIGFSEIAFRGFFLFQVHVGRANEEIQFSVLWLCDGIFLKIGKSTLKIFKGITADTAGIGNCIGIFRECFFPHCCKR